MRKFKKFGGQEIDDIVSYITEYIKRDPGKMPVYDEKGNLIEKGVSSNIKISVGCDSKNKKRHVLYAIAIMFYDDFKHNGAHVVYKRIRVPRNVINKGKTYSQWEDNSEQIKEKNIIIPKKDVTSQVYNRLLFEAEYTLELGQYFEEQLKGKYYIEHEKNIDGNQPFNMVELHLDFNPEEGINNMSNMLYEAWQGAYSGYGFSVKCKPHAHCATSAADLLVK